MEGASTLVQRAATWKSVGHVGRPPSAVPSIRTVLGFPVVERGKIDGAKVKDWNPKKTSSRFQRPPVPKTVPMAGSAMSFSFLPSRSKSFSCEEAFCSYCAKSFPPKTEAPCSTASDCGMISFQASRSKLPASVTKTR